jgi:hypothetical protein
VISFFGFFLLGEIGSESFFGLEGEAGDAEELGIVFVCLPVGSGYTRELEALRVNLSGRGDMGALAEVDEPRKFASWRTRGRLTGLVYRDSFASSDDLFDEFEFEGLIAEDFTISSRVKSIFFAMKPRMDFSSLPKSLSERVTPSERRIS